MSTQRKPETFFISGRNTVKLHTNEKNFCVKPPRFGGLSTAAEELPSLVWCGITEAKGREYFKEGEFSNVK